jgi:hypothetical protein
VSGGFGGVGSFREKASDLVATMFGGEKGGRRSGEGGGEGEGEREGGKAMKHRFVNPIFLKINSGKDSGTTVSEGEGSRRSQN